ncbi:MAG: 4-alpha-glucanotransferase, partial [Patescibacteria group bacterium]
MMYVHNKKIIGTLLPLSALKSNNHRTGKESCGTFAMGRVFLQWLRQTDQHAWQLLPLHQTHLMPGSRSRHVPSPYKGYGVGIDPRYRTHARLPGRPRQRSFVEFLAEQEHWLRSYALFCAVRDHFGTDDWTQWPVELRDRDPQALGAWERTLDGAIERYQIEQYVLHDELFALRRLARTYGILLIGDMSFYLPLQSSLVWEFHDAFRIEREGGLSAVSGLPNGAKMHYGRQVWGHPLYAWSTRGGRERLLSLWKMRITYLSHIYDMVRFDHVTGFYQYGSMDMTSPTRDTLARGPGTPTLVSIIGLMREAGLDFFVEDSSHRSIPRLHELLKREHIPSTRIARYIYNEKMKKINPRHAQIDDYPHATIAYTSTHDTEPLAAYIKKLSAQEKRDLCSAIALPAYHSDRALACGIRSRVLHSPAHIVLIQFQDWFLRNERM